MENSLHLLMQKLANPFIYISIILIVADTLFGCIRAIKEHSFNSCFGIDGAIRKISMLMCLVLCAALDLIIQINVLLYLPDAAIETLSKVDIDHLGLSEFFAVLFILYESVSVLKNTYLCGLPTKGVYMSIRKFLLKFTDELPEDDGITKGSEENENIKNQIEV